MAPIVDRLGIERVLSVTLGAGASCILAIGLFDPPIGLAGALIFGAGIGVGAQGGINVLSGLINPPNIRLAPPAQAGLWVSAASAASPVHSWAAPSSRMGSAHGKSTPQPLFPLSAPWC